MSYTVYIIYSPLLDKYYTGHTEDIKKRMNEHNSGMSTFTSKTNDWVVKYFESFPTREAAMKREKEIKNKKSRKYIEWLINIAE
ncbi:MAG: GIY-YIG nuclease family protein [Taibaiella sp.]|nr:GIY-YIG nuclease family protein [Taibaiella sp.]